MSDASFDALSGAGIFSADRAQTVRWRGGRFRDAVRGAGSSRSRLPSTSWVATIFSAMSWLVGTFPDQAQDEIFADRDPRISGVFSPTGTGVPKDDGLVVSGRWGFNTGCHGARWTVLNAVVGTGAEAVPTCVIARSRELDRRRLVRHRDVGDCSNTIVADNVFVPGYRCLRLPDMLEARLPARHNAGNSYFNYPLSPVLTVNAGGTRSAYPRRAEEFACGFRAAASPTFCENKAEAPVTIFSWPTLP